MCLQLALTIFLANLNFRLNSWEQIVVNVVAFGSRKCCILKVAIKFSYWQKIFILISSD